MQPPPFPSLTRDAHVQPPFSSSSCSIHVVSVISRRSAVDVTAAALVAPPPWSTMLPACEPELTPSPSLFFFLENSSFISKNALSLLSSHGNSTPFAGAALPPSSSLSLCDETISVRLRRLASGYTLKLVCQSLPRSALSLCAKEERSFLSRYAL